MSEPRTSELTVEVDGRVWSLVELEGRESWDLYAGDGQDGVLWLAHIAITYEGYLSTDRAGAVRGPYVTLSEASYPLCLDDPLLLGDVVAPMRANDAPPAPPSPDACGRTKLSWGREIVLLAAALGLVLLGGWFVSARRRTMHRKSGRRSVPRRGCSPCVPTSASFSTRRSS